MLLICASVMQETAFIAFLQKLTVSQIWWSGG
jgi:hypothetical protein